MKLYDRLGALIAGRRSPQAQCLDAQRLHRAGDTDRALERFQAVLQRFPRFPAALHGSGVIALEQGRFGDARNFLAEAAELAVDDIQIQYDLGEACRLSLDWQKAATCFSRVIEKSPDIRPAMLGLAESLIRLGRAREARAACGPVLESASGDSRGLLLASELALLEGDPVMAERHARTALARDPADRTARKAVARALIAGRRPDEAEALLQSVLDPADEEAHMLLVELAAGRVRQDDPAEDAAPGNVEPAEAAQAPALALSPLISIVICSVDKSKFDAVVRNYQGLLSGERIEIIGIHDARSLCEAYNRAAIRARGELLVYSHDDIEVLTPDFGARLKRHLAAHDVVGACGSARLVKGELSGHWMGAGWPHLQGLVAHHFPEGHAQAGWYRVLVLDTSADDASGHLQGLDGMFIAARREVVERCRFDEETFDGFHLYDLDFSFSAYLAGFDVAVFRDITMIHYTYAESPGYREQFGRYCRLFEAKHAANLSSLPYPARRFIPAPFRTRLEVRDFCRELLACRRRMALPVGSPVVA